MSMPMGKVLDEALQLPGEDRGALAEKLWESLMPPGTADVIRDPDWLAEIERRANSTDPGLTWEEAEARIMGALDRR